MLLLLKKLICRKICSNENNYCVGLDDNVNFVSIFNFNEPLKCNDMIPVNHKKKGDECVDDTNIYIYLNNNVDYDYLFFLTFNTASKKISKIFFWHEFDDECVVKLVDIHKVFIANNLVVCKNMLLNVYSLDVRVAFIIDENGNHMLCGDYDPGNTIMFFLNKKDIHRESYAKSKYDILKCIENIKKEYFFNIADEEFVLERFIFNIVGEYVSDYVSLTKKLTQASPSVITMYGSGRTYLLDLLVKHNIVTNVVKWNDDAHLIKELYANQGVSKIYLFVYDSYETKIISETNHLNVRIIHKSSTVSTNIENDNVFTFQMPDIKTIFIILNKFYGNIHEKNYLKSVAASLAVHKLTVHMLIKSIERFQNLGDHVNVKKLFLFAHSK